MTDAVGLTGTEAMRIVAAQAKRRQEDSNDRERKPEEKF